LGERLSIFERCLFLSHLINTIRNRGPPDLIVKSYEAATQCPREPADIAQYLKNLSEGKHIDWRAFGEQSRFACIRSQIEQEERHQWDKLIPVANRTIHRKPRL
jgi:hypothetical protein